MNSMAYIGQGSSKQNLRRNRFVCFETGNIAFDRIQVLRVVNIV